MMPRVSVLLPVYNGAAFLKESLDSILSQQYRDFEVIVLNDGSSDDSSKIVNAYNDSRIRYVEHKNMGLPATLNRGLEVAMGEIVVRQDQDDISLPDRIARQVECLDLEPCVGLVGSWANIVDESGHHDGRVHCHPQGYGALQVEVLFDSPFVHSSVAMRRDILHVAGGYCTDPSRQPPEDFELWSRLLRKYRAKNIPKPLVLYREVSGSISRVMKSNFMINVAKVSAENLRYWALRAGVTVDPAVAAFTAARMTAQNDPHDGKVSCEEVLATFDAACAGIVCSSGPLDEEARMHQRRLRDTLRRSWSVGVRKTSWGRTLERARWKCLRVIQS